MFDRCGGSVRLSPRQYGQLVRAHQGREAALRFLSIAAVYNNPEFVVVRQSELPQAIFTCVRRN